MSVITIVFVIVVFIAAAIAGTRPNRGTDESRGHARRADEPAERRDE